MEMIIYFEISYGRYLKDSAVTFREADENDKVAIADKKHQYILLK
jgi:hypothetical protein